MSSPHSRSRAHNSALTSSLTSSGSKRANGLRVKFGQAEERHYAKHQPSDSDDDGDDHSVDWESRIYGQQWKSEIPSVLKAEPESSNDSDSDSDAAWAAAEAKIYNNNFTTQLPSSLASQMSSSLQHQSNPLDDPSIDSNSPRVSEDSLVVSSSDDDSDGDWESRIYGQQWSTQLPQALTPEKKKVSSQASLSSSSHSAAPSYSSRAWTDSSSRHNTNTATIVITNQTNGRPDDSHSDSDSDEEWAAAEAKIYGKQWSTGLPVALQPSPASSSNTNPSLSRSHNHNSSRRRFEDSDSDSDSDSDRNRHDSDSDSDSDAEWAAAEAKIYGKQWSTELPVALQPTVAPSSASPSSNALFSTVSAHPTLALVRPSRNSHDDSSDSDSDSDADWAAAEAKIYGQQWKTELPTALASTPASSFSVNSATSSSSKLHGSHLHPNSNHSTSTTTSTTRRGDNGSDSDSDSDAEWAAAEAKIYGKQWSTGLPVALQSSSPPPVASPSSNHSVLSSSSSPSSLSLSSIPKGADTLQQPQHQKSQQGSESDGDSDSDDDWEAKIYGKKWSTELPVALAQPISSTTTPTPPLASQNDAGNESDSDSDVDYEAPTVKPVALAPPHASDTSSSLPKNLLTTSRGEVPFVILAISNICCSVLCRF